MGMAISAWARIHVDFAGIFLGQMFLVIVDAHSKWAEVRLMGNNTQAEKTTEVLRSIFASYGLPEQLVSDNGPQFVSEVFVRFCKEYGIKHIKSAPYHPATNGAVERFIQTFKIAMKMNTHLSVSHRLDNFLLAYRTTPHVTTNAASASLFLNRHLRTRLTLLRPEVQLRVCTKQEVQKRDHDRHLSREYFVRQRVWAQNVRGSPNWITGVIVERSGPVSYVVEVSLMEIKCYGGGMLTN